MIPFCLLWIPSAAKYLILAHCNAEVLTLFTPNRNFFCSLALRWVLLFTLDVSCSYWLELTAFRVTFSTEEFAWYWMTSMSLSDSLSYDTFQSAGCFFWSWVHFTADFLRLSCCSTCKYFGRYLQALLIRWDRRDRWVFLWPCFSWALVGWFGVFIHWRWFFRFGTLWVDW